MPRPAISAIIWLWLLAIPLAYNPWTLDPALYTKFLLLDISLAVILLWYGIRGEAALPRHTWPFYLLYGSYIALSAVSMSIYQTDLPDGIFVWLHLYTLPVAAGALLAIDRRSSIPAAQVAAAISTMAALACVLGLVQYYEAISTLGTWQLKAGDAVKATFANKNICAEVLLLTLPFSIYRALLPGRWRVPAAVSALLTATILAITFSRAVWLAGAIALPVTLCCYLYARGYWRPRWYHAALLVGVVLISCLGIYAFLKHTDAGDHLAYFYNKRNTIRERQHLWAATWEIFSHYVPLGSGAGSWRVMNMRYGIVGLRDYTTFFQQPHNDYLWVLSDQGILSFAAAGMAWLYVVRLLLRRISSAPADPFQYALLFALTGYAVYACFAFPRERAEHGILLSFIVCYILRGDTGSTTAVPVPRYLLLLLSAVVLAGAWYAGQKMMAEVHLRRFFAAREQGDIAAQRAELDAIDTRYFLLDGTATPVSFYSGMWRFAQKDISGATADFEAAVRANPYHAYSLSNVATCRNMAGDRAGAERYFREALEYAPGFPDAALNLCAIKYNAHQTDSAAWYLGMAEDTMTDARYARFISVVAGTVLSAMRQQGRYDSIVTQRLSDIEKKPDWQHDLIRKAYLYHRSLQLQIVKDVAYVIRYQDRDTVTAAKFENENHITP